MRKLTSATLLIALSGTLVVSTVATPFALVGTDAVGENVVLKPADGPNGDYAFLDENDELVIDLSGTTTDAVGVNDDAVTVVEDVFVIHYNGSQLAHVWLTDDAEDVTFYARGQPIQSASNNVTLAPNETVAVGVRIDTRGDDVDGFIDEITVHGTVAEPSTSSQGGAGSPATATESPTSTPITPTLTESPTPTESPTATPEDTDSGAAPTESPTETSSPTSTATATPTSTATPNTATTPGGTSSPIPEPGGFGLDRILGLLLLLALVVVTLLLTRRLPNG